MSCQRILGPARQPDAQAHASAQVAEFAAAAQTRLTAREQRMVASHAEGLHRNGNHRYTGNPMRHCPTCRQEGY